MALFYERNAMNLEKTNNSNQSSVSKKRKATNPAFHSVRQYDAKGHEKHIDLIEELDKERIQYNKNHGTNYSYAQYKLFKNGLLN